MKSFVLKLCVGALALMTFSNTFAQGQLIQLFAHRGSRFEFDENTMTAFKASYAAGLRGYETDIRMTKDGQLVISHDASLGRLTPCTREVETMTAAEIRQVKTKQGNEVAFLEELTNYLADKDDFYVEFEMKTNAPLSAYPQERLKEYCTKLYNIAMAKKPAKSTYVFTSSDTLALRMMQSLHPGVDLLLIVNKPINDETVAMAKKMNIKRLGCRLEGTTRDAVKKCHKEGVSVSLWPTRSPEDFMLGAYLGADAMTSDVSVSIKQFLDTKATWIKYR